jgi:hypothetical protein
MLTYTTRRNLYGTLTNDTSTANLTLGDTLLEQGEREIASMQPWPFLEQDFSISTVASQQSYNLVPTIDKVLGVSLLVSTFRVTPKLAPTVQAWDQINSTTVTTSNYPEWYFVSNGQISFFPIPSETTANAITVHARLKPIALTKADYTTGTITTLAALGTAVTGSGTSWTAGMIGNWIRITADNAANKGDGVWYQISAVGSTTTLTISRPYQGVAIAAGAAAYTIGQSSVLPEAYDILPVYKACQQYLTSVQPMPGEADRFASQYDNGIRMLKGAYGSRTNDVLIDTGDYGFPSNPNNAPTF